MTAAKQTLETEEKLREVCVTFINMPVLHCIPWQKRFVGITDCGGEGVRLKRCLFYWSCLHICMLGTAIGLQVFAHKRVVLSHPLPYQVQGLNVQVFLNVKYVLTSGLVLIHK